MNDFKVGDRVQIHPGGVSSVAGRYGKIVRLSYAVRTGTDEALSITVKLEDQEPGVDPYWPMRPSEIRHAL